MNWLHAQWRELCYQNPAWFSWIRYGRIPRLGERCFLWYRPINLYICLEVVWKSNCGSYSCYSTHWPFVRHYRNPYVPGNAEPLKFFEVVRLWWMGFSPEEYRMYRLKWQQVYDK